MPYVEVARWLTEESSQRTQPFVHEGSSDMFRRKTDEDHGWLFSDVLTVVSQEAPHTTGIPLLVTVMSPPLVAVSTAWTAP